MEAVLSFLAGAILGLVIMVVMFEGISFSVYGWFIKEDTLDAFFSNHLEKYQINDMDKRRSILYAYPEKLPFCSNSVFAPLGCWYIDEYGRIPFWSKWHSRLNDKRLREIAKIAPQKKKLAEL